MKLLLSKSIILLGVFALIMGTLTTFGIIPSYADNLEVIGNEVGLELKPTGKQLFNLTNMNPGDTNEAKVTIKNTNECKFELFLKTERMTPIPEGSDLFKQMILTIYYGESIVYNGPMEGFAKQYISLGMINTGNQEVLRAVVHLPGLETGNEFQGQHVEVKWIFMAEQRCDPGQPVDPEVPGIPIQPSEPNTPETPQEANTPLTLETITNTVLSDNIVVGENPIVDEVKLEEIDEEEIVDELIPEANIIPTFTPPTRASLPRTGAGSGLMYYLVGTILLGVGIKMRKKE